MSKPKSPWRSVKDELPSVGEDVAVPHGGEWIKASIDNKGQWLTRDSDFPGGHPHYFFVCPTHWMPIPPLPEGE